MTSTTSTSTPKRPAQRPALDAKPFYAVAGAAEVAVATLRELPGKVAEVVSDESFRAEVRERFNGLPAEAKALREEFSSFAKDAPGKAAELPARLRHVVDQASHEAAKTYDELAHRGEGVVSRLRREGGDTVETTVTAIRGKVADVADDVADAAGKAADEFGDAAEKARPRTTPAPQRDVEA